MGEKRRSFAAYPQQRWADQARSRRERELNRIVAFLLGILLVLAAGCGPRVQPSSSSPRRAASSLASLDATQLAARYHLPLNGPPVIGNETVSNNVDTAESHWRDNQRACLESGYDLRPFAGRRVVVTEFPLRKFKGFGAAFWVVESGGKIVGAWVQPSWDGGSVGLREASQGF
jgi:hypothetical protein